MKKLAPLFAFLIAATPAVVRAQDPLFDRINLKLQDKGKVVDVTVTKSGKAVFVFPDHVVTTTLTKDQLAHLETSVKGVFTRGSPATDLGGAADKPTFELTMNAANGTRWTAKGPVDLLRGGPMPPVYNVVRDLQDMEKALPAPEERLALPAPAERLALPAPEERLALPAPAERLALPAPAERLLLPAPPERLLLPAPAPKVPASIVFTQDGRRVEVLPATGELVVTTSDGVEHRIADKAAVDGIVKAATDARLADYANRFKVKAASQADPFTLTVTGDDGKALVLEGPADVSSWNSAQLRESVGPIVGALAAASKKADADQAAARAAAEEKTKGKPGLFGMNRFIESFKEGAAKFEKLGADTFRYLQSGALKAKATAALGAVGDFFKSAWERFRGRGEAKVDARTEDRSTSRYDSRGFSRSTGMADALDLRVRGEADRAEGKGVDKR